MCWDQTDVGFKRQPREILKFVNSSIHLQNLRSLLLMYRDVRKARLDIEHTRALSSRPCIAPTFSSLAAPSALLVGGFCAWEEEGAPSSAALTRRAAPPMYAMGGAASFSAPPITEEAIVHERVRGSAVALSPSPPHVTHVSTPSSFQSSQRRHEHACIARS